jgi:hypothetical protein
MKPKSKYIKKKDRERLMLEMQQPSELIDIVYEDKIDDNEEKDILTSSSIPFILHEEDRYQGTYILFLMYSHIHSFSTDHNL